MSKSKVELSLSLPEEAYTLIKAAACIYGLKPKAYLKMVATQCALEDLERLGRVIDTVDGELDGECKCCCDKCAEGECCAEDCKCSDGKCECAEKAEGCTCEKKEKKCCEEKKAEEAPAPVPEVKVKDQPKEKKAKKG